MEKGIRPIAGEFNADNSVGESNERRENQERINKLNAVLGSPDGIESIYAGDGSPFRDLNIQSILQFYLALKESSYSNLVNTKLFNPHDCTEGGSEGAPMRTANSVVAFDGYRIGYTVGNRKRQGSLILFKKSEEFDNESPDNESPDNESSLTIRDFGWGENCAFGAVVKDDSIRYFRLVQKKEGSMYPTIAELDSSSSEAAELEDEIDNLFSRARV